MEGGGGGGGNTLPLGCPGGGVFGYGEMLKYLLFGTQVGALSKQAFFCDLRYSR